MYGIVRGTWAPAARGPGPDPRAKPRESSPQSRVVERYIKIYTVLVNIIKISNGQVGGRLIWG